MRYSHFVLGDLSLFSVDFLLDFIGISEGGFDSNFGEGLGFRISSFIWWSCREWDSLEKWGAGERRSGTRRSSGVS